MKFEWGEKTEFDQRGGGHFSWVSCCEKDSGQRLLPKEYGENRTLGEIFQSTEGKFSVPTTFSIEAKYENETEKQEKVIDKCVKFG